MKTMKKKLKWPCIVFFSMYLLYFFSIALVLNTRLFRNLADMKEEDLTHVNLMGAISPFPGYLWIQHGEVFISDQNVSITIHLDHVFTHFSLSPFFEKTALFQELHIKKAWVDLGMKTTEQSMAHLEKHTEKKDVDLAFKRARGEIARKTHIRLVFKHIVIDDINEVKTSLGDFKGEMNLAGGFMIQPGVEVEVYPSELNIKSLDLAGEFAQVRGKAQVAFDRFFIPDSPGNVVFPNVNAQIDLEGLAQSLRFLNLTLRTLPQYKIDGESANVKTKLVIEHGRLIKGSFLTSSPSQMTFHTPDIIASGLGEVDWSIQSKEQSELRAHLHRVKVEDLKNKHNHGSVASLDVNLTLFGNELIDAFHGLGVELKMKKIRFSVMSAKTKKNDLRVSGQFTGDGKLVGIAGDLPPHALALWKSTGSNLKFHLSNLSVQSDFFPPVQVVGEVAVVAKPIDFSINTLILPQIKSNFTMTVQDEGNTSGTAEISDANYLMTQNQWKGKMSVILKTTEPVIKALQKENKISGLVATLAKVNDLKCDLDWELGNEFTWLHVNQINSSGIWKAYGSLLHNDDGMQGAFEVRVFHLPIGIKISPQKTEVSFLPSSNFYPNILH